MILNGTVQLVSQASKQQLGLASAVPEIDTDEGRPPMSGPCRNNVYIRARDRDKHVCLIITFGFHKLLEGFCFILSVGGGVAVG